MDKESRRGASRGHLFWVLQQHQDVEVVEGGERPDTTVSDGERTKHVFGPYRDRAAAQKLADDMTARTLRAQVERSNA